MFRIRDIFVRILIHILGSVPLTNFSGCGFERLKTYGSYVSGSGTLVHVLSFFKAVLRIRNKSFGSGFGSGTVPLTNGSGSGRSKNMQIGIRILNTDQTFEVFSVCGRASLPALKAAADNPEGVFTSAAAEAGPGLGGGRCC